MPPTALSNLLRMLYSGASDYPPGQPLLYAESFSPNTPEGACPRSHGLGRVYEVTEQSMVPDDLPSIRERAIAAWPPAWHGQNLRDIVTTLGYDIDTPWRNLPCGRDCGEGVAPPPITYSSIRISRAEATNAAAPAETWIAGNSGHYGGNK